MARKNLGDAGSFLIFLLGILLFFSLATYTENSAPTGNLIGRVGTYTSSFLLFLLGRTAFIVPVCLLYMGGFALYRGELVEPFVRLTSMIVLSVTAAIWIGLLSQLSTTGWIGETLGGMLSFAFGRWGGFIVSFGVFIPATLLSTGATMQQAGRLIASLYTKLENRPEKPESGGGISAAGLAGMAGLAGLAYTWLSKNKSAKESAEDDVKFLKKESMGDMPLFERKIESQAPAQTTYPSIVESHEIPRREQSFVSTPASSVSRVSDESARIFASASVGQMRTDSIGAAYDGHFTTDQSRFVFRKNTRPISNSSWIDRLPTAASVISSRAEAMKQERISLSPGPAVIDLVQVPIMNLEPAALSEEVTHTESVDDFVSTEEAEDAGELSVDHPSLSEPSVAHEQMRSIEKVEEETEAELEEDSTDDATQTLEYLPTGVPSIRRRGGRYSLPTDILNLSNPIPVQDAADEVKETTEKLEKVLRDFGIPGSVVRTQRGPIITLFEVLLDSGVRLNKILGIEGEIRMHLSVPSVRIVAPLPGKPTVGLEIPNRVRQTVTLGELARKDRDFFSKHRLGIVLGKDISGKNLYLDLTRAPHLLIAGASGQGKSVYLNSAIASLLYKYSPEEVRFIMIDPKMVELKLYEGIPHLLLPVITDPRQAARALAWIIQEMEYRYAHLSRVKCRDILSYNERMKTQGKTERIPFIVIVIDELSDLMLIAPKEVEDALWRLSQKARAVGIHMIMATQRPSVDVITPHIKANAAARVAFHVAQKVDSRIILDQAGADALLGGGDMLYKSPDSTGITRVQAPLITEEEIASIVQETRRYGEAVFIELGTEEEEETMEDDGSVDAELLDQAWKIILESGKPTTSYIQRRMRIGYNRAANIIETLEMKGYLGPAIGTSRREILRKQP